MDVTSPPNAPVDVPIEGAVSTPVPSTAPEVSQFEPDAVDPAADGDQPALALSSSGDTPPAPPAPPGESATTTFVPPSLTVPSAEAESTSSTKSDSSKPGTFKLAGVEVPTDYALAAGIGLLMGLIILGFAFRKRH